MKEKDVKAIERINLEIEKIDTKKNSIYFFVIDTKGNPSGSLKYIYKLAKIINDEGYNVTMLYQKNKDEEFIGVGEWLGEEYSNLRHADIALIDSTNSTFSFVGFVSSNLIWNVPLYFCARP